MKKRQLIAACLLMAACCTAAGQQANGNRRSTVTTQGDSIIIRKGQGDMRINIYEDLPDDKSTDEVKVYEGVYVKRIDADRQSWLDAIPFIPNKNRKRNNAYEPHNSGVFIGFTHMTDNFMGFSDSRHFPLDLSQSWEFGFNFLSTYHNFSRNPHWGLNIGVSWGYRSFNIDGPVALLKQDGRAVFSPGDEGTSYSQSRLRHFFFRVPITAEWQQRLSRGRRMFFNLGPEIEIRHGVKSFAHINGGKKKCVGKGMYVNPVGVGLLTQAGYGNLGVYLRYSFTRMFQEGKGPEVSPYSFGLAWYW